MKPRLKQGERLDKTTVWVIVGIAGGVAFLAAIMMFIGHLTTSAIIFLGVAVAMGAFVASQARRT